jgi:hypothetical protein
MRSTRGGGTSEGSIEAESGEKQVRSASGGRILSADEELLNCLEHLYDTWNGIAQGSIVVGQVVDIPTARKLRN